MPAVGHRYTSRAMSLTFARIAMASRRCVEARAALYLLARTPRDVQRRGAQLGDKVAHARDGLKDRSGRHCCARAHRDRVGTSCRRYLRREEQAARTSRGGQREEWEARRARSGPGEWSPFDLPFLVASESKAETLADPIPEFRKTIWEFCSTNENHGRCLDALCAICRHRWRGGGSLNPPTCSRPGRIGRADVNSIASIAPTLAVTLAYAATTRLVAFPATSMVATDASLVHGAALH